MGKIPTHLLVYQCLKCVVTNFVLKNQPSFCICNQKRMFKACGTVHKQAPYLIIITIVLIEPYNNFTCIGS